MHFGSQWPNVLCPCMDVPTLDFHNTWRFQSKQIFQGWIVKIHVVFLVFKKCVCPYLILSKTDLFSLIGSLQFCDPIKFKHVFFRQLLFKQNEWEEHIMFSKTMAKIIRTCQHFSTVWCYSKLGCSHFECSILDDPMFCTIKCLNGCLSNIGFWKRKRIF